MTASVLNKIPTQLFFLFFYDNTKQMYILCIVMLQLKAELSDMKAELSELTAELSDLKAQLSDPTANRN